MPSPAGSKKALETRPAESPDEVAWLRAQGQTLSAIIIRQIRDALFEGRLDAGTRLGSEASLAESFGVSRMAMRDALRSLQASGIVDIRVGARGGVYIAEGDPQRFADSLAIQLKLVGVEVEELFDTLIAVEVMSTELAARKASEEDIARLRGLLDELEAETPNKERFGPLARRFHQALVDASHNRILAGQFRALALVAEPYHARRLTPQVAKRVVAYHRAVLESIEARDPDRARRIMRDRLDQVRARQLTGPVDPATRADSR